MAKAAPVALITGASAGIGLWTARELAARGYQLILVCRHAERGEQARQWLLQQCPTALAQRPPRVMLAELSDFASIRALAAQVRQDYPSLALLINNAGCFQRRRTLTSAGIETTLAVNTIAPFLLMQELLPLLQKSGAARIVNVGSASAERAVLDLDQLQTSPSMLYAYAASKLALWLLSCEQARRLAHSSITVNYIHPGVVATKIGHVGGVVGAFWRLLQPFLLSPRRGAACTIAVATEPEWGLATGCYVNKGKAAAPHPQIGDHDLAQQLWNLSTDLAAR